MQTPGGYGCPEFAPPGLASVLVTEFREQTAEAPSAKLRRGNDRIKFWMRGHLNSKDREGSGEDQTRIPMTFASERVDRPGELRLNQNEEHMQKGEGDVGRLLTDETMVRDIEAIVAKASGIVSDLGQLVSELQLAASNVKNLSQGINARDGGVPGLLRRADATLVTLQQSMRDLALATQRAPQIVHSVELGARDLPGLLTQTQQTAHQLEELAIQLRGLWLLGGGGKPPPQSTRLPTHEVRP